MLTYVRGQGLVTRVGAHPDIADFVGLIDEGRARLELLRLAESDALCVEPSLK